VKRKIQASEITMLSACVHTTSPPFLEYVTVGKINTAYVRNYGVGATLISCNFRTGNGALKWILKNVQLTLK